MGGLSCKKMDDYVEVVMHHDNVKWSIYRKLNQVTPRELTREQGGLAAGTFRIGNVMYLLSSIEASQSLAYLGFKAGDSIYFD
jgi:hypothetical protein